MLIDNLLRRAREAKNIRKPLCNIISKITDLLSIVKNLRKAFTLKKKEAM